MSISPFVSSVTIEDKTIKIEAGAMARQADGSVLATCGEDVVLASVVSVNSESCSDFFPLTVEYQEKFYSAGKIPGGFFRREGRPSYEATLMARMIDRPMRPCFPEGYFYDTQIVVTTLSYSGQFPIGILGSIAASSAVHISDIPFNGPVAVVQVGKLDGSWRVNLGHEEMKNSSLNLTVAGTASGLLMVEGESNFISEAEALEALKFAHKSMQPLLDMQNDLRDKSGNRQKRVWTPPQVNSELQKTIETFLSGKIKKCLQVPEKTKRAQALGELKESAAKHITEEEDDSDTMALKKKTLNEIFEKAKYDLARSLIINSGERIDGRKLDQIRPISCQTGLLPRVHGSALFTRGETQVLGTVTLGTGDDEQKVDALSGFSKKHFLLHYNFPPYSVGETGRMGGQSRREIGHGFLAEKALKAVLPKHDDFPYTIRVVSEVLESNGSSSMGTVCSGCLALMDAGVPVKEPVAGIAMGLIQEKDKTSILSDILGDEDHLGDMDFKVAGTKEGITALQMDIKIDGLSFDVMEKALEQARAGRLHILKEMGSELAKHREQMSPYAPRIEILKIKPEKIREVIGSGGKVINKIIEDTGVKVDIHDSGSIYIASPDNEKIKKAVSMIEGICAEVEVGAVYEGKVVKVVEFGAFVELLPNTSGLLHISEIDHRRIREVSDVLNEGDSVKVKVLQVGDNGRIRLSRKAILEKPEGLDDRDPQRDRDVFKEDSPRGHGRRGRGHHSGHKQKDSRYSKNRY